MFLGKIFEGHFKNGVLSDVDMRTILIDGAFDCASELILDVSSDGLDTGHTGREGESGTRLNEENMTAEVENNRKHGDTVRCVNDHLGRDAVLAGSDVGLGLERNNRRRSVGRIVFVEGREGRRSGEIWEEASWNGG